MRPPMTNSLPSTPPSSLPTSRSLFLIGPRGSGKSTVARLLAERLGWDAVDADALLEGSAGKSIRQIFADEGEPAFRDLESSVLARLCRGHACVVATGGGVVLRAENRERLRSAGRCVWLTADAPTLWGRLQADSATAERRPDLSGGGLVEVEELLRVRDPLYRACADLIVDTTGRDPEAVAEAILSWWDQS